MMRYVNDGWSVCVDVGREETHGQDNVRWWITRQSAVTTGGFSPGCEELNAPNSGVFKVCGPPLRQSLEKGTSSDLLVYLLSFPQILDAHGIMIMLFDPIDTQELSQ